MTSQAEVAPIAAELFSPPTEPERFAGLADPEGAADLAVLRAIARKIRRTHRPHVESDIPAGATYLAQFAVHDLDFLTRDGTSEQSLLDLALIYGDGPKNDAFCYQVPAEPGAPRYLLRLGRTRPTATSPAWGAMRDLPRAACPHFDGRGIEAKTEVLVPNTFSDSNMLLAQMQTLWALAHNAIAAILVESRGPRDAFALAQAINREIYRDAILHDVLGNWLMPRLRPRYARPAPGVVSWTRAPAEFMAGVGRLGHGLVREIYAVNAQMPVTGLRNLMRQTSTGRPYDMPLTEDWLVDFSHFFAIGSAPQKARALGPHVARPVATGAGLAAGDPADDSIVLRDLLACTRGGLASVRTLIGRASRGDAHLFEGCFAQDEGRWTEAMHRWLSEAGIGPEIAGRLALDPPLTLFLMLEAEADSGGRSLGALGSVLMGETLCAALPVAPEDPAAEAAKALVFGGAAPRSMADLIRFLQRHYKFAEGARLHPREDQRDAPDTATPKSRTGDSRMFDNNATAPRQPIPRIEVADFIEMGRLVAEWSVNPKSRPADVAELIDQLDGIATVPDRIKNVEFVQSTLDTLYLRLPVKEMIEESIDRMSDPMASGQYPLPQFYSDFYRPGFGPVLSPLDTLLARVGDYTIAQCK